MYEMVRVTMQPSRSGIQGASRERVDVLSVAGEVRARDNGTNILIIRSPLRIHNATDTTLEVLWVADGNRERPSGSSAFTGDSPPPGKGRNRSQGSGASDEWRQGGHPVIAPGNTWAVPLALQQDFNGGFKVKPIKSKYVFSTVRTPR